MSKECSGNGYILKPSKQILKTRPYVSRSHIANTNSFIFEKEVFEQVGGFDESYQNGEDGDLWMRISELYKGAFSDHFGVIYRINHNDAQLSKNNEEDLKKIIYLYIMRQ